MSCQLVFVDGFGNDIGGLLTYEDCGKSPSRPKSIASSTRSQSHYQSCCQGDNVRVGDLVLGEIEILLDGYSQ